MPWEFLQLSKDCKKSEYSSVPSGGVVKKQHCRFFVCRKFREITNKFLEISRNTHLFLDNFLKFGYTIGNRQEFGKEVVL